MPSLTIIVNNSTRVIPEGEGLFSTTITINDSTPAITITVNGHARGIAEDEGEANVFHGVIEVRQDALTEDAYDVEAHHADIGAYQTDTSIYEVNVGAHHADVDVTHADDGNPTIEEEHVEDGGFGIPDDNFRNEDTIFDRIAPTPQILFDYPNDAHLIRAAIEQVRTEPFRARRRARHAHHEWQSHTEVAALCTSALERARADGADAAAVLECEFYQQAAVNNADAYRVQFEALVDVIRWANPAWAEIFDEPGDWE